MVECFFELNDKPMSALKFGARSFDAYSGTDKHRNRRSSMCFLNIGPIPIGEYYIFDRQIGGNAPWFHNLFGSDKSDWFALFAIDGKLDDEVLCNQIKRGEFRLHPEGRSGVSRGCVTIKKYLDWLQVKSVLRASPPVAIPGTELKAYGRLRVR